MNAPGNTEQHFAELRERLGLYEQVPVVEDAHPVAMAPFGDQKMILCCHDRANDDVHHVMYEVPEGTDFLACVQEDGSVNDEMRVQLQHALGAAYN